MANNSLPYIRLDVGLSSPPSSPQPVVCHDAFSQGGISIAGVPDGTQYQGRVPDSDASAASTDAETLSHEQALLDSSESVPSLESDSSLPDDASDCGDSVADDQGDVAGDSDLEVELSSSSLHADLGEASSESAFYDVGWPMARATCASSNEGFAQSVNLEMSRGDDGIDVQDGMLFVSSDSGQAADRLASLADADFIYGAGGASGTEPSLRADWHGSASNQAQHSESVDSSSGFPAHPSMGPESAASGGLGQPPQQWALQGKQGLHPGRLAASGSKPLQAVRREGWAHSSQQPVPTQQLSGASQGQRAQAQARAGAIGMRNPMQQAALYSQVMRHGQPGQSKSGQAAAAIEGASASQAQNLPHPESVQQLQPSSNSQQRQMPSGGQAGRFAARQQAHPAQAQALSPQRGRQTLSAQSAQRAHQAQAMGAQSAQQMHSQQMQQSGQSRQALGAQQVQQARRFQQARQAQQMQAPNQPHQALGAQQAQAPDHGLAAMRSGVGRAALPASQPAATQHADGSAQPIQAMQTAGSAQSASAAQAVKAAQVAAATAQAAVAEIAKAAARVVASKPSTSADDDIGKPLLDEQAIEESSMFDRPPIPIEKGMQGIEDKRKRQGIMLAIIALVMVAGVATGIIAAIALGGGLSSSASSAESSQGTGVEASSHEGSDGSSQGSSNDGGSSESDSGSGAAGSGGSSSGLEDGSSGSESSSKGQSGDVTYTYIAKTSAGKEYSVEETVTFDSDGDCLTSRMCMTFSDDATAKAFTDALQRDYGSKLTLESLEGSFAIVEVDNSALRLDRKEYENALRYSVTDLNVYE